METKDYINLIKAFRQTGSTTFILEAAMANPNCIIVFSSRSLASNQAIAYDRMISKKSWLWRWWHGHTSGTATRPFFVSFDNLKNARSAFHRPVIYDNSCMLKIASEITL